MIIVSDGFAETGVEGIKRERELRNMVRSFGIRIIGPNTVGIFNAADRISTVPYDKGYEYNGRGRLSIITQTGMYGPQAMAWNEYHSGINKVIDLGNMCDIDETDSPKSHACLADHRSGGRSGLDRNAFRSLRPAEQ